VEFVVQLKRYREVITSSAKETAAFTLIDIVVLLALSFVFRSLFLDTLGLVLLVEGAVLMLVGGALGIAGQPGMRSMNNYLLKRRLRGLEERGRKEIDKGEEDKTDLKAALYMLSGVFLFVESLVLAVLGG